MIKAALLLLGFVAAASAADFPVTWTIPANRLPYPSMKIELGDSITFNWEGAMHGVYMLNNGPGEGCPTAFPAGPDFLAQIAQSGTFTWTATLPGIYNIACPVEGHCPLGMIIEIEVGNGPAEAPGPVEAPSPSAGSSYGY